VPPLADPPISLDDGHQVGDSHWPDGDTSDGGQGRPVARLRCDLLRNEDHQIHSHLSIYLNGEALAVPAQIGVVQTTPLTECSYPLHTVDSSGLIHVDDRPDAFTLGQFFQIWGEPLSYVDVGGNPGLPVVVYVTDSNIVTQYTGDLNAIELLSHREITIQIGTPISFIPNYTWTGP